MSLDPQLLIKSLSPKIASKAVQTFDRATTIVVGACWAAAVLMMAFAIYTTMLSVSAKRAAETAFVTDPKLPKIVHQNIDPRDAQVHGRTIASALSRYHDFAWEQPKHNDHSG